MEETYVNQTKMLTNILAKMKHGTIIRHKETGSDFSTLDYTGTESMKDRIRISMCGARIGYYKPENIEFEPFEFFCIFLKTKGKKSFYYCDERGLFDTRLCYSNLNEFVIMNIKSAFPTFKGTQVDVLNYLEYFCKERNEWIKLINYE